MRPLSYYMKFINFRMLSSSKLPFFSLTIKHNTIETHDALFDILPVSSYQGDFWSLDDAILSIFERKTKHNKEIWYTADILLSPHVTEYEREVYGLIGFIGDLGGVFDLVMAFLGLFISPISSHSFVLKALGRMYLARTSDSSLFTIGSLKKKNKKSKFKTMKIKMP